MTSAIPFFFHESHGFQNLKMLRYSGTADRKLTGQFADCGWPLSQQIEDSLTSRIGKGAQQSALVSHALP